MTPPQIAGRALRDGPAIWEVATSTYEWLRTFGQFPPSLPAPKRAAGNELFTLTAGDTLVRALINLDLYVTMNGATGNIDFSAVFLTLPTVGLIVNEDVVVPPSSNTPQTDLNPILPWRDWSLWEHMYPTVDFVNVVSPQFALATWRFRTGIIDVQSPRKTPAGSAPSIWMPWEVQDGSGLINSTTAGVTYALGARFSAACLIRHP